MEVLKIHFSIIASRNRINWIEQLEVCHHYPNFKKALLYSVKVEENSLFGIHNLTGVKLLTRLQLNFNHFNECKFRHGFCDAINPKCYCDLEVDTTTHSLLCCHLFSDQSQRTLILRPSDFDGTTQFLLLMVTNLFKCFFIVHSTTVSS